MKFFTATAALFSGAALAHPLTLAARSPPCPDLLYSAPTCCSADVLGLADLSCSTPDSAASGSDLQKSCGGQAKSAKCCTLELAEIGVLCQDPVGV